jgi:hypothetical protein
MDIDEGRPADKRRESSFSAADFIWSLERATELTKELLSA